MAAAAAAAGGAPEVIAQLENAAKVLMVRASPSHPPTPPLLPFLLPLSASPFSPRFFSRVFSVRSLPPPLHFPPPLARGGGSLVKGGLPGKVLGLRWMGGSGGSKGDGQVPKNAPPPQRHGSLPDWRVWCRNVGRRWRVEGLERNRAGFGEVCPLWAACRACGVSTGLEQSFSRGYPPQNTPGFPFQNQPGKC